HQDCKGWQYIIVPTVKASQKSPIRNIQVFDSSLWRGQVVEQMTHYKNRAPYAEKIIGFVHSCLEIDEIFLSRLNVGILSHCSELLGINSKFQFCSELNIGTDVSLSAEERILDICEYFGATEYVNLPGGVDLYHPEAFERRNIKLTFRNLPTFVYPTGPYAFEPNLSIIDLLMWNKPEDIRKHLEEFRS
ncbi:MAG TPA: WbqC family protein, partial [Chitinophagales bacterium]|nr:WbqC family protein [Chitinophagales bacterium]